MANSSKDLAGIIVRLVRDESRMTQKLPKLSAREQKVVVRSTERGNNGSNHRRN